MRPAALLLLVACGAAPEQSPAPQGVESKGTFTYVDAANASGVAPKQIAVGTHFTLRFRRNGRLEDGPVVKAVSPQRAATDGNVANGFVATTAGPSLFFVEDASGAVLDIVPLFFLGSAP